VKFITPEPADGIPKTGGRHLREVAWPDLVSIWTGFKLAYSSPRIDWEELLVKASEVPVLLGHLQWYEDLLRTFYAADASQPELIASNPMIPPYQAEGFLLYAQAKHLVEPVARGRYRLTVVGHEEVRRVRLAFRTLLSSVFGPGPANSEQPTLQV